MIDYLEQSDGSWVPDYMDPTWVSENTWAANQTPGAFKGDPIPKSGEVYDPTGGAPFGFRQYAPKVPERW
jgi:hypothetical protein